MLVSSKPRQNSQLVQYDRCNFLFFSFLKCIWYLAVSHEEIIEKIRKQVALEERAHHVIEQLTEITASEEYLKEAVS